MGQLVYSALASLDGYVADDQGSFDWAEPDEEVHRFVNDLQRGAGTHLYGRRMYDVLVAWETIGTNADSERDAHPEYILDFARLWRAADKIVFSRSLAEVHSARTRIERTFDPDTIARLKAESTRDLVIGGPDLARQAIAAGLVDAIQLFLAPVVVGGGNRALPGGVRLDLELADQRRFASGVVYLGYRVRR